MDPELGEVQRSFRQALKGRSGKTGTSLIITTKAGDKEMDSPAG